MAGCCSLWGKVIDQRRLDSVAPIRVISTILVVAPLLDITTQTCSSERNGPLVDMCCCYPLTESSQWIVFKRKLVKCCGVMGIRLSTGDSDMELFLCDYF